MITIELIFRYRGAPSEEDIDQGICNLLSAWMQNGQIGGKDWFIVPARAFCRVILSCPEAASLARRHANKWVRESLAALKARHLAPPTIRIMGREHDSPEADRCPRPSWYILVTDYLRQESPLRCGDHGLPVPLYRVPHTYDQDPSYHDTLQWESQWKAFDHLQMMCGPYERGATRQISDVRSKLSKVGLDICRRIAKASGIPTYYYLYRGGDRRLASELARPCPSCGGRWRLGRPLHGFLDFKCDRCRLVSNVAWSVRSSKDFQEMRDPGQ